MNNNPLFCIHCGSELSKPVKWPNQCVNNNCGQPNYNSPKPVVALVLHANKDDRVGVVLIQRGIEPYKGEWAFPGGYIDHAEGWQQAASREAHEELGITLNPLQLYILAPPVVTPTNYLVMFVGYMGEVTIPSQVQMDPMGQTQGEVLNIKVATSIDNIDLGVPSHQDFWKSLPSLTF